MSHQNYLFLEYRRALDKFRKLQIRFEKRIANNTLQELTVRRRHRLLSQLRRLKNKIEQLASRMKLATAGGSLAMSMGLVAATQTEGLAAPGPSTPAAPKELVVDKTLLNSEVDGDQENPAAAMNDLGQHVFVWESSNNQIMGKGFGHDDEGLEFTVTDDTLWNTDPTVSLNDEGDFVVAWTSMEATSPYSTFAIKYMRFEIEGEEIIPNGPFTLAEGTNTANEIMDNPDVALDENGNFAIVWETYNDGDLTDNIRARYVDSEDISAEELEVTSHSDEDSSADSPAVDIDDNGNFMIVWHGSYYEHVNSSEQNDYSTIYAERYHENEAQGSQIVIEHTDNQGRHRHPDVALSGDGSYAVTWQDEYDSYSQEYIYVKRFDSGGENLGEITVEDQSNADISNPVIAADKDGGFVIAYNVESNGGYYEIIGKRYNQIGDYVEDLTFQDSGGEEEAGNPAIAMNSRGDFVIAWDDEESSYEPEDCEEGQDCEGTAVYYKRYSDPVDLDCVMPERMVNEYSSMNQRKPVIDMNADGDHAVVWEGYWDGDSEEDYGIVGRFRSSIGIEGDEFHINTTTTGWQSDPDVAIDDDGNLIAVWKGSTSDISSYGVFARLYDATGTPLGDDFRVDEETDPFYNVSSPAVDINNDGDMIVVWASDNEESIDGRIITGQAAFDGSTFPISTATMTNHYTPGISINDDGSFVVSWDASAIASAFHFVYTRKFDNTASPIADPVEISDPNSSFMSPDIEQYRSGGDYMVAWSEQFGSNATIRSSKYDNTGNPIFEKEVIGEEGHSSSRPKVDSNSDGDFVVTWYDYEDSSFGIRSAFFDSENEFVDYLPYTDNSHKQPDIALSDEGDLVIVTEMFSSDYDVYAKTFHEPLEGRVHVGNEFIVNTNLIGDQANPDVAKNEDGDFVVAWLDTEYNSGFYYQIKARQYNAQGISVGDEIDVSVQTTDATAAPEVALDDDGNFMIVWRQEYFTGGESQDIIARTFNADGEELAAAFIVNQETSENQSDPDVAVDPDGNFTVIWGDHHNNYSRDVIKLQRFTPAGASLLENDLLIDDFVDAGYDAKYPSIAINDDGDVAISSYGDLDDSDFYVDLIVYNKEFSSSSGLLLVGGEGGEFAQHPPGITADSNGDFVVVWSEYDGFNEIFLIKGRRYNASTGLSNSKGIAINEGYGNPMVAAVDDGDFVVIYDSYSGNSDDNDNVLGQRFDSEFETIGPVFDVNDYKGENQQYSAIAACPDGNFTVVWQSYEQDGNKYAVMAKQFGSHKPVVSSSDIDVDEGGNVIITSEHLTLSNPSLPFESYVSITDVPNNGILYLGDAVVTTESTISEEGINSLIYEHDGSETSEDSFSFTASNDDFSTSSQTLDIIINPINDSPTLTNPISDQSTSGRESFSYTVPANTFADAETTSLTLSATLADGSALPSWLSFDGNTGVFSGTAPVDGNFDQNFAVKVTASDGEASVSDEFTITVASVLAVNDQDLERAKLYPNPVESTLHLRPLADMTGDIQIYFFNQSGKMISRSRINKISNDQVFDIDVQNLRRGLYFVKMIDENITATFKISKE